MKGVPQHPAWKPIIGILPEVLEHHDHIFDWLVESHRKIGRSFQLSAIGPIRFCWISMHPSPENAQHVLKDRFENYHIPTLRKHNLGELLGKGIFTSDGKAWHQQRKSGSLLFTARELRGKMTDVFVKRSRDFIRHLQTLDRNAPRGEHATVDLHDLFFRWTMDCFTEIAFSYRTRAFDAAMEGQEDEFGEAFDIVQSGMANRYFKPWWKLEKWIRWPFGDEARITKHLKVLNRVVEQVVDDRLAHIEEELNRPSIGADLITHFLKISHQQKMPVDREQMRDIVVSFLIAGRDTTACAMSHFLHEMSRHPHIERKVREEILRVLRAARDQQSPENQPPPSAAAGESGGASGQIPSSRAQYTHVQAEEDTELGIITPDYRSVNQMNFLEACLRETLRLHPSKAYDAREAQADDVLPDGTPVPAGSVVAYTPYLFGRSEENWGPDVMEFKPERWLNEDGSLIQHSQYKYPVFNAGPRICLGQGLAFLEMKLLLSMLLQRFRFTLVPGAVIHYRITVTLQMKNGLPMRIHPVHPESASGDDEFEFLDSGRSGVRSSDSESSPHGRNLSRSIDQEKQIHSRLDSLIRDSDQVLRSST